MDKIVIEFSRSILNEPSNNKLKVFNSESNIDYLNFLYDNYADKVLGFIINHMYSTEDGEMVLIEVFEDVWKNLSCFREDQKILLKLLKVTAGIISKEKLVAYILRKSTGAGAQEIKRL
jgi:hypothetical protein